MSYFMWTMALLPWATLFFAGSADVRRFMPVVIFSTLLVTAFFVLGYVNRWWTIERYILPPFGRIVDVAFVYGIYPVGTFWIFRWTVRKFILYFAANAAINAAMIFVVVPRMARIGVLSNLQLPLWIGYMVNLLLALVLYGYYRWQTAPARRPAEGEERGHARLIRPQFDVRGGRGGAR